LKKFLLMAVLVVMVVSALALPALARGGHSNNNNPWWANNNNDRWANNNNPWWANDNNGDNNSEVSQDNQQDVHSGASSQGIIIEGGGDNSNQCIGLQPISNTGSAVNQTGVLQDGSLGGVGVDNSGNLTISPSQTTVCDQKVDQAASASNTSSGDSWYSDGTGGWWYWDGTGWWYLDSSGWWYYNSDGSWSFYGW
jgi:hypothetical protein